MRRVLALMCAVACATASASSLAEETRLKAVSFLPLNRSFGIEFTRWIDEFNRRAKGTLQIDGLGPQAIPVMEQANAVRSGVVQMQFGPPTYYTGMVWEADALALSEKSVKELRANGAWDYLDKLHQEKMNVKLLAGMGDGVSFFVFTTVPVKTDDQDKPMSGLTLRSVPIYRVFFESLGARTVSMPPADTYTALERNVVQGYGLSRWGVKDFGLLPLTKFRYGPGFYNTSVNILVNLDFYKKLTPDQKKLMDDMALWLDDQWPAWRAAQEAKENKDEADAGVKYFEFGAWFSKRAHDTYWAELEKKSPQHIPHLRKLVAK